MIATAARTRLGGHVVAESLAALGAEAVFGVPGIHALAIWEALRGGPLRTLGFRTELAAGFAADGYARAAGGRRRCCSRPARARLNSLTALMEAATAHVPVVAISSQEPRALLGRGRGYLHELPDQRAVFAPVVKHAARAESAEGLPEQLAAAWRVALTPPTGPGLPRDPRRRARGRRRRRPSRTALDGAPPPPRAARPEAVAEAAAPARRRRAPVLWAGGGVERSGAWAELAALAERLDAPVATTYMGKGAFPADHPLSVGSGCDEAAFQALLDRGRRRPRGRHGARRGDHRAVRPRLRRPADPPRRGARADRRDLPGARARRATRARRSPRCSQARRRRRRPAAARRRRAARPARPPCASASPAASTAQGRETERGLLADVAAVAGPDAVIAWDMTILAYWAAAHFPQHRRRGFLYPLGSGTLGYAFPAALGAQAALPGGRARVAVAGDGGILYALAGAGHGAPARAAHHARDRRRRRLRDPARVPDDAPTARTHAVDLVQPDFAAVAQGFGVPVRTCRADGFADGARLGRRLRRARGRRPPRDAARRRSRRRELGRARPARAARRRPVRAGREPRRADGPPRPRPRSPSSTGTRACGDRCPACSTRSPAALGEAWAYPEHAYNALREAIAAETGATPAEVVPGHGIQALIVTLLRAFVRPGDAVVVPELTYGLYAQASRVSGARVVPVPNRELGLDLERLAAAARETDARIVWICDPNNPTGSRVERRRSGARCWTACRPAASWWPTRRTWTTSRPPTRAGRERDVADGRRVVVLRTFSKIFGLAGLRLGYALAARGARALPPRRAGAVQRQPRGARGGARLAGPAGGGRGAARAGRGGARPADRRARGGRRAAAPVRGELRAVRRRRRRRGARASGCCDRGVLVRTGADMGLPGRVRITVGPEPVMDRAAAALLAARDELLGERPA